MNANPEEKLKKTKDKLDQEQKRQRVKSDEKLKQISAIKERLNTELTKFKETGVCLSIKKSRKRASKR